MNEWKDELSLKAKNGIDFISAATLVWLLIAYVWTLGSPAYSKSVLTFIVGSLMLPLALLLSKVYKTIWRVPGNPLQPLGLILNFAQLFYFPFLILVLIRMPEYFVMTYAIITGAHFFPYFWYYNTKLYAVFAGIISIGSLLLGLWCSEEQMFYVPVFCSACLLMLAILLFINWRSRFPSTSS